MSSLSQQTPRGTHDFLPAEAESLRAIEDRIRGLWRQFGYREVITPTFERYESLALGANEEQRERMFKFFDREGEILALRSDVTTPIARLVATRLRDAARPLRLYYVAPVFRWSEDGAGRQREFFQAGVELIGAPGPEADAEVVLLAVLAMRAVGLTGFRIDLGQVNFFNALLDECGLPPAEEAAVRANFLRKDLVGLQKTLAHAGKRGRESLLSLTDLRGGAEVIERARRLPAGRLGREALDNLSALVDILTEFDVAQHVQVDLALVKDFSYYTGMVLEGYAPNLGYTLCTGGRYDQLHGQFGADNPATGFALGLTRLTAALGESAIAQQSGPRVLVSAGTNCRSVALELTTRLRNMGAIVEWQVLRTADGSQAPDAPELVFYMKDGAAWFRLLGPEGRKGWEAPVAEFGRAEQAICRSQG